MLSSIITAVSALAVSAAALPATAEVEARQIQPIYDAWHAIEFRVGGGSGGSGAVFNVTAPDDYVKGVPGFNVYCGPIYGYPWAKCAPATEDFYVQTKYGPGPELGVGKVTVSHYYNDHVRWRVYNATGSALTTEVVNGEFDIDITNLTIAI